ncbi:hypothetical protein VKT23_019907 [Stygiomarasmius scandens]|uniref:Uncharacterized protein n=1 Tax=Marasmiellus scandens TaxID=2682957 RepID=A0ABR1IPJ5_9AGAR
MLPCCVRYPNGIWEDDHLDLVPEEDYINMTEDEKNTFLLRQQRQIQRERSSFVEKFRNMALTAAARNDNGQDRVIVPGFLEEIPEQSEPSESSEPEPEPEYERTGFFDDADIEYVDSDDEDLGNLIVKTPSETSSESKSEEEEIGSHMTSAQVLRPITGELVDSENDEPVQDTNESWGYPLCETPAPDWGDCVSNADDMIDHDNSYVPEWKKSCERSRNSWPGAFGVDAKIIENNWEWKGLEQYNDLATKLHYISEWNMNFIPSTLIKNGNHSLSTSTTLIPVTSGRHTGKSNITLKSKSRKCAAQTNSGITWKLSSKA